MGGSQETGRLREGSAQKRENILAAARDLFVEHGVERTSMDAIAALAAVSKRTVYDYYGDKRRLLLGVVEDAGGSALRTLQRCVATSLRDADGTDRDPRDALPVFAAQLGRELFGAADYVAAVRLIAENETSLPELDGHPLRTAHTEVLADWLARQVETGSLHLEDPMRAADHFYALTTLRVLHETSARRADLDHVVAIMEEGADVFLRAYGSPQQS